MSREMSYADTVRVAYLTAVTEEFAERLKSGEGLFPRETEEMERARLAHNRAAREHNARVQAERDRREAARQRRENEREIAAVRKQMCDSCFTVLPASGVCGNCC
jgi:hypothetical protein